jgi:hypothetical protein
MRAWIVVCLAIVAGSLLMGCSGEAEDSSEPVTSTASQNKGASGLGESGPADAQASGGPAPMKGPSTD